MNLISFVEESANGLLIRVSLVRVQVPEHQKQTVEYNQTYLSISKKETKIRDNFGTVLILNQINPHIGTSRWGFFV